MGLPENCDSEMIAEVTIGLLYLTFHGSEPAVRAWKDLDWDVLDLLHEKGWIGDPKGKARSVMVTKDGEAHAKLMFDKHFRPKSSG